MVLNFWVYFDFQKFEPILKVLVLYVPLFRLHLYPEQALKCLIKLYFLSFTPIRFLATPSRVEHLKLFLVYLLYVIIWVGAWISFQIFFGFEFFFLIDTDDFICFLNTKPWLKLLFAVFGRFWGSQRLWYPGVWPEAIGDPNGLSLHHWVVWRVLITNRVQEWLSSIIVQPLLRQLDQLRPGVSSAKLPLFLPL